MFSGIVCGVGRVLEIVEVGGGLRVMVGCHNLSDIVVGSSVAVSGACMTVEDVCGDGSFWFSVSAASLSVIVKLAVGVVVNLESSLRIGQELGGHFVSGHVDGVASVISVDECDGNRVVTFELVDDSLTAFIARKGSIAVDGVSLTVNSVVGRTFTVNLIPYTLSVTNLQFLQIGSVANIEVDMIARYLMRFSEVAVLHGNEVY